MKSLILFLLLIPGYASAFENNNNNIVVVFDDSRSMAEQMNNLSEDKLTVAKRSLNSVLKKIPNNSKVGIFALNSGWIYPIQTVEINSISKAINNISANGGTPLGAALKVSADELLKLRQKEHYGEYRLLILSDGEAGDNDLLEENLMHVLSRGITVDVIGLDMSEGHSLSNKVNRYRSADDPKALSSAIYELIQAENNGQNIDSFSEASAFSDESATAILSVLAENPNHLIGEQPPVQNEQVSDASVINVETVAESPFGIICFIVSSALLIGAVVGFIVAMCN